MDSLKSIPKFRGSGRFITRTVQGIHHLVAETKHLLLLETATWYRSDVEHFLIKGGNTSSWVCHFDHFLDTFTAEL